MKKQSIRFKVSGNVTWVSKSGRTENTISVNEQTILDNVTLKQSEDGKDFFDIVDKGWTIFGVHKKNIAIVSSVDKQLDIDLALIDNALEFYCEEGIGSGGKDNAKARKDLDAAWKRIVKLSKVGAQELKDLTKTLFKETL
jgi:hypothetical protein